MSSTGEASTLYFMPVHGRVAHSMAIAPARHDAVQVRELYHSNQTLIDQ